MSVGIGFSFGDLTPSSITIPQPNTFMTRIYQVYFWISDMNRLDSNNILFTEENSQNSVLLIDFIT